MKETFISSNPRQQAKIMVLTAQTGYMREAILKYGTPRRISSGSLLYILRSRSGQIITTAENSTPKTAMLRTPMATRVLMLSVSLLPQYWAISTLHPAEKPLHTV